MKQKLIRPFIFSLVFLSGVLHANLETLYSRVNEENLSEHDIKNWVNQFDSEDRDAAVLLLDQIHYYSYRELCVDLKALHKKVLSKLKEDGFVENSENEMAFDDVVFSKTYPAKSGDLISYFYRSANVIRAVAFKNLPDFQKEDNSNKALVILEDYVGTGTQFLLEYYSKQNYKLFNSFKKVYFVALVASDNAIKRFEKVKNGDYHSLGNDFISIMNIQDEAVQNQIHEMVRRIPQEKLEIVYLHKELPLNHPSRDAETTKKIFALLEKYNIKRYLGGNYSSFGYTVFFYNCPNNLPEILWNSQSVKRDGSAWTPLFRRVEDLSIYDIAKDIPIENQIW